MIEPTDTIDGAELYLADCRDVLPHLPKVDAVIADPPYGIGFKYSEHDDTPEGYGRWLWSILEQAERLCNPGSPVFVWQGMQNARRFSEWFPRDWRLFAAAKNFVQIRPHAMQNAFDPVVVWWTEGKRWNADRDVRDFHVADTASVLRQKGNLEKGHPCPRPLDQVKYIVRGWCRPGGKILDPFMGSATAGLAATQTGRKFIGIEKDPKYYAIARERILHATGTGAGQLFSAEALA